jgi:hypothetical protein
LLNTISGLLGAAGAAVVGDYESIATTVVGSGGTSTITFSSIPSTYKHLQIRGIAKGTTSYATGTDTAYIRFNSDTGSNYTYHALTGSGTAASAGALTSQTFSYCFPTTTGNASANNIFGTFAIDILDYSSTTKNKTFRSLSGVNVNNAISNGESITLISGAWLNNSTAINRIDFNIGSSTFAQYSHFALYGIKG